jgi:hypothetical protein
MYQLLDEVDSIDCSLNPEFILMMAEGDEAECEEIESLWLAGLAVTNPKPNDY